MLPDLDLVPLRMGRYGTDMWISIVLLLAVSFSVWSMTGIGGHIKTLLDPRADDVWFEADVARVYDDMTDRGANHYRTTVHPIFPLLTYPGIKISERWLHIDALRAVRGEIAATAGLWLASFYFLLRLLHCRRLDAIVFAMVAASTSAALFWTVIPETYEFGSFTIVGVLVVAALAERHGAAPIWVDIAAGAASMSVLVTDFMVSVASFVSRYRLRQAFQIACNALVLVVLLWGLEKYFFPSARFFLGEHDKGAPPSPRATALVVMFLHSFVAPDVWSSANEHPPEWPLLSFQHAALGGMSFLKVVALASWVCLLGFGAWALTCLPQIPRFRKMLALSIAGQIVLHLLYGGETFLYALDWLPLFVAAAALASLSRWRAVVLGVAALFVVTGGAHNVMQVHAALASVVADGAGNRN